jgi:hypothetical protein
VIENIQLDLKGIVPREIGALLETPLAEEEALEAAMKRLELSTSRAERTLDGALAEVQAALTTSRAGSFAWKQCSN